MVGIAWPAFASTPLQENRYFNVTEIYLIATSNPETPKEVVLNLPKKGIGNGYCVQYAEYVTGIYKRGDAWQWAQYINSSEPSIGSIVVLDEGPYGHLAAIIDIKGDIIKITEQNYLGRYIISQRELLKNYSKILGYVKP